MSQEKHSPGAFVIFKEHLKLSRMSSKEIAEYAKSKGLEELKGKALRNALAELALVEAYDKLVADKGALK